MANAGEMAIALERVTYFYPQSREPALREVSLSINAGAFVGIIGANGAGKSTLCAAIAGFVPHHFRGDLNGRVVVAGRETQATPLAELVTQVGFVFQNPYNQLSGARLTVAEEVAFGLENLGVPRAEMLPRIQSALDLVGLRELADRSPYDLSGGEMQRLALACILVMEPGILVLDEPTAQLDPLGTRQVFAAIRSVAAQRRCTVVVVEQKIEWMASFADRIIALHDGMVALDGSPRDVLTLPKLEEIGIAPLRYTTAARRVRAAGMWSADSPLPATLEQAVAGFKAELLQSRRQTSPPTPLPAEKRETFSLRGEGNNFLPSPAGKGAGAGSASTVKRLWSSPGIQGFDGQSRMNISIRDLWFRYPDGVEALRGISLEIPAGESVVFIGQNGSGKTTLAKHLNGLLRPTRGEVEVGGWNTRTHTVAQMARRVGFLFQNSDDQIFKSRVADEVAFSLRIFGVKEDIIAARVEAALGRTDLAGQENTHPYELLPSQRKWVALASLLAVDPPVLALDEPTTGQDARGLDRLGGLIEKFKRAGKTIVAMSHDMDFCAEHFDRVVVLKEGRILADGEAAEVLAQSGLLADTAVDPPQITRLGMALGLPRAVMTVEEFVGEWRSRS